MTVELEEVRVPQEILLVEDEKIARESLARLLKRRGYEVALAESGSHAILHARTRDTGVVLMDIALGEEMDGIDAALAIRELHPLTSFIFVTAYVGDPDYRKRVRESRIRVGGWLEKPIKLDKLIELIGREHQKLKVLAWLEEIQGYGLDPFEYLGAIEGSLAPDVLSDLWRELETGNNEASDPDDTGEIIPLKEDSEENTLMALAGEVDAVYEEIRQLVVQRSGQPSLREELRPLREKLEMLQEREADAMERHFRRQLEFDPEEGRQLIELAERLLRKP